MHDGGEEVYGIGCMQGVLLFVLVLVKNFLFQKSSKECTLFQTVEESEIVGGNLNWS